MAPTANVLAEVRERYSATDRIDLHIDTVSLALLTNHADIAGTSTPILVPTSSR